MYFSKDIFREMKEIKKKNPNYFSITLRFFSILLDPVLRLHDKFLAYMYDISTMGAIPIHFEH